MPEHKFSVVFSYPEEREILEKRGPVVKVLRANVSSYTCLKTGKQVLQTRTEYAMFEAEDLSAGLDVCWYCGNLHDDTNPRQGFDCSCCGGN